MITDARHREVGPELHRHDHLVGRRLVHHPDGQPGRRLGRRHRVATPATGTTRRPAHSSSVKIVKAPQRQREWRGRRSSSGGAAVAAAPRPRAAAGAAAPARACETHVARPDAPCRPAHTVPRHPHEGAAGNGRSFSRQGWAIMSTVPATSSTIAATAARAMDGRVAVQADSGASAGPSGRQRPPAAAARRATAPPRPRSATAAKMARPAQHPAVARARRRPGSWPGGRIRRPGCRRWCGPAQLTPGRK